jgi:transposase
MPPHLSSSDRIQILLLRQQKLPIRTIAARLHCSYGTVATTLKKWKTQGTIELKPQLHPSLLTSPQYNHNLTRLIQQHRQWTSRHLASEMNIKHGVKVSEQSIRRHRRLLGFKQTKVKEKQIITEENRLKRLNFAAENRDRDWEEVWFSDEKLFKIDYSSQRVWKQPKEEAVTVFQTPKSVSVLVWGAISFDLRTTLHCTTEPYDSDSYCNVIWKHLIHQQNPIRYPLLQDNSMPHTSNHTLDFLSNFNVDLISNYPPRSPELNPIEHVWGWMVKHINKNYPQNITQLKAAVREAWDAVPQEVIQNYIQHLPAVCSQIIRSKGNPI